MQDLRVIGVESGALVVAADGGAEYRLPVTPSLRSQLRAAAPDSTPVERKAPPREIQSLIRSGLSPEQAAERTGADLAYVRRFEGPVLAERSHALRTALGVAVTVAVTVTVDCTAAAVGIETVPFASIVAPAPVTEKTSPAPVKSAPAATV